MDKKSISRVEQDFFIFETFHVEKIQYIVSYDANSEGWKSVKIMRDFNIRRDYFYLSLRLSGNLKAEKCQYKVRCQHKA